MSAYDSDKMGMVLLRQSLQEEHELIGEERYRGDVGEITIRCYHLPRRNAIVTSIQPNGEHESAWDYDPLVAGETPNDFWKDMRKKLSQIYNNYRVFLTGEGNLIGFEIIPSPRERDIN